MVPTVACNSHLKSADSLRPAALRRSRFKKTNWLNDSLLCSRQATEDFTPARPFASCDYCAKCKYERGQKGSKVSARIIWWAAQRVATASNFLFKQEIKDGERGAALWETIGRVYWNCEKSTVCVCVCKCVRVKCVYFKTTTTQTDRAPHKPT